MQCRYCHQKSLTDSHICPKCIGLIDIGAWEQLAYLQLFFHPEEWVHDVAAFIELAEGLDPTPPRVPVTDGLVTLTADKLAIVRSALADAGYDFAEYCRDCSEGDSSPCEDHRIAALRRRQYQQLHDELGRTAAATDPLLRHVGT